MHARASPASDRTVDAILNHHPNVSSQDEAQESGFFSRRPLLLSFTLTVLFLASFCIRVYRITDPPLDFHPVRQYDSALLARSYYFRYLGSSAPQWMRTVAACQDPRTYLEPPIMESVTMALYFLAGGVEMWIPRLLSSLFWLLGGAPLYLLVRRTVSTDGAVVSTAFYLLLPYGVFASRTFMPNPLMVMMLLLSILLIARYGEEPTVRRAAIAAAVTGLAILIEPFPLFMTLGAFAVLAIQRQGFRKSLLNPRSWIFATIAVLPPVIYYWHTFLSHRDTSLLSFQLQPQYLFDPLSYRYWLLHIQNVVGFGALILALLGVLMFRRGGARALAIGLWCGYVVYGLVFIYHMRTHDYYQLLLIPLVAICLGPVGALLLARLDQIATHWPIRAGAWSVLALALVLALGVAGTQLARLAFDEEVRIYQEIGEAVHHSTNTVFLDGYAGYALEYHGWLCGRNWPFAWRAYGLPGLPVLDAEERFAKDYADSSPEYFIITNLLAFEEQSDLRSFLTENFPLVAQTEDYLVFDLRRPVDSEE